MDKNVGNIDSHLRLFLGFSLLGMGVIKSSKTMVALGATKIATGISRFCPILYALKLSTVDQDDSLGKLLRKLPEYKEQAVESLGLEE